MPEAFDVRAYSIDTLCAVLAERAEADLAIINAKTHRAYFESYFQALSATTILIENDYVDRDFLEDFAAYYVRCFFTYKRNCARLHFFNQAFSKDDFDALLRGESGPLSAESLQKAYLGFVVVKPLPQAVIGRTCLKTYSNNGGQRAYPITREYKAHLYGIPLTVDTLAFQEQDHVAAACATSALWSAFHGTCRLFQHALLSPVEITKAASVNFPLDSRSLPNQGLTTQQMAHAIRSVGLEPFLVSVKDAFVLRTTLYAYLRGHVPVLMGVSLFDVSGSTPQFMGRHAVAVTGYGFGQTAVASAAFAGFVSRACLIDRIYAHDDQVGPFARMQLDGIPVTLKIDRYPQDFMSLSTSWRNAAGLIDKVRAVPDFILVPLYHKIRIPFGAVQDAVGQFDAFLEWLRLSTFLPYPQHLQWDVYLTDINDLKSDLIQSAFLSGEARREILLRGLPRFLWRATAYSENKAVLDLLFDATDIDQGRRFVQAIEYDAALSLVLRAANSVPPLHQAFPRPALWKILEWFRPAP